MSVSDEISEESSTQHSSSSSEDEGEVLVGAVRPYANEPLASSSDSEGDEESDNEAEDEDGIPARTLAARSERQVELNDWCKCGRCRTELLEGAREFRCCKEVQPVIGKLLFDGTIDQIQCVTEHSDYSHLTYKEVLLMVGPLLRDKNGKAYRRPPRGQNDHQFCRAVAYRWLIKWLCGYLGWENRRPLPACVYNDIRTKYATHNTVGYEQES